MLLPAESVNFVDVGLEGAKAVIMLVLAIVMWRAADKYPQMSGGAWNMIIFGFLLMFIGFLFDFSDEIIDYEASELAETLEAIIEEVSLIGGLILVTVGFGRWFSFVGRFLGLKAET